MLINITIDVDVDGLSEIDKDIDFIIMDIKQELSCCSHTIEIKKYEVIENES